MTDIYEQHRKAFSQVAAYVVMDQQTGKRVATVAIKFPKDGAGRLRTFVHWIGTEMQTGWAGGYVYDKRSVAVREAAKKIQLADERHGRMAEFLAHLLFDDGRDWNDHLRDAEFEVLQAV